MRNLAAPETVATAQAALAQATSTATSTATSAAANAGASLAGDPRLSLSVADLAQLFGGGLSQAARLIDIETAQGSGLPDSLAVDRFYGTEGVNQLFSFEVDCLSVSAHVDLAQFIGEEITLRVLLPNTGKRSWHGYCTAAAWLGADGGMARYRLTLSPFLAFLGLRHDAYIFQDKDALGICEELFKDYPQAHVRYEVTQALTKRAICTQYGESDLAFMTRLLAQEGLSYRFEHEQSGAEGAGNNNKSASNPSKSSSTSSQNHSNSTSDSTTPHAKHCLVIFDAASSLSQWPSVASLGGGSGAGAGAAIRFHRAHATEASDTITRFSASRHAGPNAVALSAWDAAQLLAPSGQASSALAAGALPVLAVYEGAGQRRYADAASAQRIAELRLQALELPNKLFQGTSSARHLAAGATFSLAQHEHYSQIGGANAFKLLQVNHAGANNLPAQVAQLLQSVGFQSKSGHPSGSGAGSTRSPSSQNHSGGDGSRASSRDLPDPDDLANLPRGVYRNQFTAVRAVVPVVPLAMNATLAATACGPQTAIVVGLAGEQLTTQRNHCVKVQFAWQRGASPLPGGLTELHSPDPSLTDAGNAPGNETSGTWVRVAEALAGPNWGSQFTPRIGTEVLIDFLDGDMDQPVIVAQLYNGVDTPPFAAGVDSGVNHGGTLSGWHSHNLTAGPSDQDAASGGGSGSGSGGYNQWVLDDTSGQLRMRLASSTAASQLNTGYLIGQSPTSAQRGAYRGSGFELRTDAWGVLRAPQGLLISTTARAGVGTTGITSTQMDTLEARAQLKGAQSLTDALQDAASQSQALGATQVKDTQAAQKLLLERLDPKEKGSYKGQGLSTLNGQSTQKTLTSGATPGSMAGRDLDTAPEAAVEKFGAPLIVAEAPSSILLASPASTAIFAGEQLHLVTQGDSHYAAAHTFSAVSGKTQTLYTHEGGLEAVAANGPLSIQAHTDQLELLADKEVTVVSVNDSISINAKTKIVLKAGQTSITLDGANITFACPGTFSVKGSVHNLDSGASAPAMLPKLADSRVKLFDEQFQIKDTQGEPIAELPYKITTAEGEVHHGITDANGFTDRIATIDMNQLKIEHEDVQKHKPKEGFDEQIQFVNAKGTPLTQTGYELKFANGTKVKGTTDADGMTQRIETKAPQAITEATLKPKPLESCCAIHAENSPDSTEPFMFKLSDVKTNAEDVGSSVKEVKTPAENSRAMTASEITMAKLIFKDSIDYSKVKIHNGEYLWFGMQPDDTAMTPNGEMYFNKQYFREDFSSGDIYDRHWFMHEMTHVWQYQLGYHVKLRGAIRIGLDYKYKLEATKNLSNYNMEAQGDILADYFSLTYDKAPETVAQAINREASTKPLYDSVLKDFLVNPSSKSNLP